VEPASGSRNSESIQLLFLLTLVGGVFFVFFLTPSLRPASFLTLITVLFLGPPVRFLQGRGIPRPASILGLYVLVSLFFFLVANQLIKTLILQWSNLIEVLPALGAAAIDRLSGLEQRLEGAIPMEVNFGLKDRLLQAGMKLREWALTHVPALLGDLASSMMLAPIFSFFILKDGGEMRRQFERLIPASYARNTLTVIDKISVSIGKFLRAKMIEGVLVGLLCYLGLKIIEAPFSGVFAVIAGITNVIPYLGPVLGILPPALVLGFQDPPVNLIPMLLVFFIANAIDMILIFPVFVARLVNLSPLSLLAAVAVGQEIYGVVGMLIAVPAASALKIILKEVIEILYQAQ
jgi:putative permease